MIDPYEKPVAGRANMAWAALSILARVRGAARLVVATWLAWSCAATVSAQQDNAPPPAGQPALSDPLVRSVLESNPTTPEEMVQAASILVDLKHVDLAKPFMLSLAEAELDDPALAALHDRFGTATFLRINREKTLQPEAEDFTRKVIDGAWRYARSPERLNPIIARLQDPLPEIRRLAAFQLRSGGEAAVAALVGILADGDRAAAETDPGFDQGFCI